MPELPEVTTTVAGLNEVLPHLTITDVWTDYHVRTTHKRTDTIKNQTYFDYFKKEIIGKKFTTAERRGKNVLIHLSGNTTILIHMKMTGHLLYGKYTFDRAKKTWASRDTHLDDPFNQFIHLIFTLSNGRHVAFSDMRKFAKVIVFNTTTRDSIPDLRDLGPEPLQALSYEMFLERLHTKPNGKIKTVLMDQTVLAGIGNIYSDEILWEAGIHPEKRVENISRAEMKLMWKAMITILTTGIRLGGDSMSDYRNIYGLPGNFQKSHKVYRRTGTACLKKGCTGTIVRKVIGGRSAHFCDTHQKM